MNRDNRRTRTVLALLLLTSFLLITVDFRGGGVSDRVRGVVGSVFGPLERAAGAVVRPVSGLVDDVGNLSSRKAKIAALEKENSALRQQLRTTGDVRSRATQLDRLLRISGLGQYRIILGQVVAVGPAQGFASTVTIDAGSGDGLTADMTVLNGDGLVGRVKSVTATTATVLLLTDPTSTVGVRLEGTRELGFVSGRGQRPMQLEVPDAQAKITKDQRLVTLGSVNNRPYVRGVPVGVITSVLLEPGSPSRIATVLPYVDVSHLDVLGVVVEPPRTDPRDSVLPPRPAASPTPSAPAAAPRSSGAPSAGSSAGPSPSPRP